MSCTKCDAPCQGGLCQQCAVEQRFAHLADELASDDRWDSTEEDDA